MPAAVGIDGVDLQAETTYTGAILPVKNEFVFTAVVDVANVGGGAAGLFDLVCDVMDGGGNVIFTRNLGTGISSKAATTPAANFVIVFGAGISAVAAAGVTLGTEIELIKIVTAIRLKLVVTEANDGTSASATVRLLAESRREVST